VALKKKSDSAGLKVWTVAELGAFYIEHRSELLAHANRILKDATRSEEVIQDALIKVMLASPELDSAEHALAYLHRTIENLCIDIFRIEGRRPNLVVLDDATSEVESAWQANQDFSDVVAAADDAAIVRQALAMLSPAERAALVMWEMEGRSTQEIAKELGIKESAVRHTVSRARASLRKVLSTLVIDEKRGLTALDLLSTSYKKASEIAHKSGRVAMSLILLVTAFLGFNSMTGTESIQTVISSPVSENSGAKAEVKEVITEEVVTATPAAKPAISIEDAAAELAFYNAQLESAAVMLETLQLIEGKE
jgi:RNA polymerase sigma factor (sigma-70 family)